MHLYRPSSAGRRTAQRWQKPMHLYGPPSAGRRNVSAGRSPCTCTGRLRPGSAPHSVGRSPCTCTGRLPPGGAPHSAGRSPCTCTGRLPPGGAPHSAGRSPCTCTRRSQPDAAAPHGGKRSCRRPPRQPVTVGSPSMRRCLGLLRGERLLAGCRRPGTAEFGRHSRSARSYAIQRETDRVVGAQRPSPGSLRDPTSPAKGGRGDRKMPPALEPTRGGATVTPASARSGCA
jgi:hypothetical protein